MLLGLLLLFPGLVGLWGALTNRYAPFAGIQGPLHRMKRARILALFVSLALVFLGGAIAAAAFLPPSVEVPPPPEGKPLSPLRELFVGVPQ